MNRLDRLVRSYGSHIAVPWREGAAAMQRVIICVYEPEDELRLRTRLVEFELATRNAGHEWSVFDLTTSFARWLSSQRYAKKYYQRPEYLPAYLPRYLDYISREFSDFVAENAIGRQGVVAVYGVGTLFGLLKVREVIDRIAPTVAGRLLVLFPGSFNENNYRLLDGYDGWNYLAVPITAGEDI